MKSSKAWPIVILFSILITCLIFTLFTGAAGFGFLKMRLLAIRRNDATATALGIEAAALVTNIPKTPNGYQAPTKEVSIIPSDTPLPSPTLTETPIPPTLIPTITPRQASDALITDGIFRVGAEIAPGKWRSSGIGDKCYWVRYGDQQETIDNHFGYSGGVINVQPSDFEVMTENCGTWEYIENKDLVLEPDASAPKNDGIYLVSVDIAPGRWRSNGQSDKCYWTHNDANQEIIDNHFGMAGGSMIVHESDFEVQLQDCGTWVFEGEVVAEINSSPTSSIMLIPETSVITPQLTSTPKPLPTVAFAVPSGRWEYFAMDNAGSSTLIVLEISPEDALLGRITNVSTRYGYAANPCQVIFNDIPIKLEEGELEFGYADMFGAVAGGFDENSAVSVSISDRLCTGSAFGILTRTE